MRRLLQLALPLAAILTLAGSPTSASATVLNFSGFEIGDTNDLVKEVR